MSLVATTRSETQLLEAPVVTALRGQIVTCRIEFASHGRSIMVRYRLWRASQVVVWLGWRAGAPGDVNCAMTAR